MEHNVFSHAKLRELLSQLIDARNNADRFKLINKEIDQECERLDQEAEARGDELLRLAGLKVD